MERFGLVILFLAFAIAVRAQKTVIKHFEGDIKIDGELNDSIWLSIESKENFWQFFPSDQVAAANKTEVMYASNGKSLFIAVKCYAVGDQYVTSSLQRDYSAGGSDNITFVIDPFNEKTNAFVFGINPYGVRREAIITNGGVNMGRDWDISWDNAWDGESIMTPDYWTAELEIPLRILRFREGNDIWRINAYRFDTQGNERSTMVPMPRNVNIIDLGFSKELNWEKTPPPPKRNISLIPYVSGASLRNFETDPTEKEDAINIGGDVKMGLTSSLNLDLTINPDFSNVDVDQQVTNLGRFEIFFPERRQFFIENANLFNKFGFGRTNPFFSRRIGVARDTADENVPVPILAGLKLSGRVADKTQLGVISVQTGPNNKDLIPGTNYSMVAVQQTINNRNNVSLFMINKQLNSVEPRNENQSKSFNRVAGVESSFASNNSRLTGKAYLHYSFDEDADSDNAHSQGFQVNYIGDRWRFRLTQELVGDNYQADVGFVPRTGYLRISPLISYINNNPKRWNQHRFSFIPSLRFLNELDGRRSDHFFSFEWRGETNTTSATELSISHRYVYLLDPFDPTRTDSRELPENTEYNMLFFEGSYRSDRRKNTFFQVRTYLGQFFNGNRYRLGGDLNFRIQPKLVFALRFDYNYTDLPEPYNSVGLSLIGTRFDYTFSKKLFWTTFVQYNEQIDNVNLNTRLQWRFAPVSDLFIVYAEDFDALLKTKNRSLTLKATYWLNL